MQRCFLRLCVIKLALLLAGCSPQAQIPDFEHPVMLVKDTRLQHPTDIVKFKGRYVATELYNDRLAIFDDLQLRNLEYFEPARINRKFSAPHFLAITPRDTLLISNGWGDSIVEIENLEGRGWKEFNGIDKKFSAPHGLCVDNAGWIYVGDSLNSRLVRFRDIQGRDWQVFADLDRQISYIRQLVCRDGVVWVSNSYENRPGLNPGQGGTVLAITDFSSGRAATVFSFEKANITGVLPINDNDLLVGLWGIRRQLLLFDIKGQTAKVFKRSELGTPYGMHFDNAASQVLVAHIGKLADRDRENIGGIAVYGR